MQETYEPSYLGKTNLIVPDITLFTLLIETVTSTLDF